MGDTTPTCPRCARPVTDATICSECGRDLRANINGIALLAGELAARMARFGTNFSTGYSPRPAETPLPFDQRAGNLSRRVRVIVHDLGEHPGDPRLTVDRLRAREDAASLADAAERIYHDLISYLDPPRERRYLGPCDLAPRPECPTDIYVEEDDHGRISAAHVACPTCGRVIAVDERRAELLRQAMDHIGTLPEITRLLKTYGAEKVSSDVLRGLVRHGRLVTIGDMATVTEAGAIRRVAAYRVGDVLDALAATRRVTRKPAAPSR